MDLIEFDPRVPHTFTFADVPTSLNEGDIILLREAEGEKKPTQCRLLFVRQNAFIHVDGAHGIRLDLRAHSDFDWIAGLIALTNGCVLEPYNNSAVKAFRLVKQKVVEHTAP